MRQYGIENNYVNTGLGKKLVGSGGYLMNKWREGLKYRKRQQIIGNLKQHTAEHSPVGCTLRQVFICENICKLFSEDMRYSNTEAFMIISIVLMIVLQITPLIHINRG